MGALYPATICISLPQAVPPGTCLPPTLTAMGRVVGFHKTGSQDLRSDTLLSTQTHKCRVCRVGAWEPCS